MTDGNSYVPVVIPREDFWDDYYSALHRAYNNMRTAFKASELTQDELADRMGCSKSLVSKRLSGEENLTLKTLSFMGTGMRCRLVVTFVPYDYVGLTNEYISTPVHSGNNITSVTSTPPAASQPNRLIYSHQ